MVNNWKLSWDCVSPALKHKTKQSGKTKKRIETLSKIKHKNVKPPIKNSASDFEIHLKTHKLENICYKHLVKKRHQTFVIKSHEYCVKNTPNCMF